MKDAPNFNRLAGLYLWMEVLTFGPFLARCRNAFPQQAAGRRRALVLGDGDGRFTARLLRGNVEIRVDAVDASAAMLASLRRRAVPNEGRVRVHLADVRVWEPERLEDSEPYDLVASHFFLDCLTEAEVQALATRIFSSVCPGAVWVISDFAIPQGWFGRLVARPLVWLLYRAFGVLTGLEVGALPDHGRALSEAGFVLAERKRFLGGLLVSELWSAREHSTEN